MLRAVYTVVFTDVYGLCLQLFTGTYKPSVKGVYGGNLIEMSESGRAG